MHEKAGITGKLSAQGYRMTPQRIEEATFSSLKYILLRQYGFSAALKHVGVFGLCDNCRKKSK